MCLSFAHPWLALSFALSICWSFSFPKQPTGFLLEHKHPSEAACCSWAPEVAWAAAMPSPLSGVQGGWENSVGLARALCLLRLGFGAAAELSETFAVLYSSYFFLFWNVSSSLIATDFLKQQPNSCPSCGLANSLAFCSGGQVSALSFCLCSHLLLPAILSTCIAPWYLFSSYLKIIIFRQTFSASVLPVLHAKTPLLRYNYVSKEERQQIALIRFDIYV